MDSQQCDRHPSAWAKARVLFPNLCTLYLCGHCANGLLQDYDGEYHVAYEVVNV